MTIVRLFLWRTYRSHMIDHDQEQGDLLEKKTVDKRVQPLHYIVAWLAKLILYLYPVPVVHLRLNKPLNSESDHNKGAKREKGPVHVFEILVEFYRFCRVGRPVLLQF